MKTSVKDRFSNVIAWLGFLIIILVLCCLTAVAAQLAWHVVSPMPEYDTELQERWNYLSRTAISSPEELEANLARLDEDIPAKEKELSILESHRAEVESESSLDASGEEELELLEGLIRSYEIQNLFSDFEHTAEEIFKYGEREWRNNLIRETAEWAFTASYFLPLWVLIVLLNYVMVGSFRLLPWRGFEE